MQVLAAHKRNLKGGFIKPSPLQIEAWLSKNFEIKIGNEDQIRICNPDGDTDFRLWISKSNAAVHDFRPNHQQYDGSFLKFVAKYKNISFTAAVKEVCGKDIIKEKHNEIKLDRDISSDEIKLPSGSISMKDGTGSAHEICMNYLLNTRGLSKESIFKANIHYCGTHIVVPYYQYDMLVYYQMRSIMNKVFKFPNESETKKKAGDFLWGFDDIEPQSTVIVVESIFNAMSIGRDTVATGGAKLKKGQIKLLSILGPQTIILAPDSDGAGIESISRDYYELRNTFKDLWYVIPPKDVDWNDMLKAGDNPYEYIVANKKLLNMKVLFDGIKN